MSNNDFDIITQDLEAINKVKSFEQKQKTLSRHGYIKAGQGNDDSDE